MQRNIVALLTVASTVYGLKCWTNTYGIVTAVTNNSTLIDCIGPNYSCVKLVDYSTGVYSKSCNMNNCTQPNQVGIYSNAYCANTAPRYAGDNQHNITSCCCYGDGCNPSSEKMISSVFGFVLSYFLL